MVPTPHTTLTRTTSTLEEPNLCTLFHLLRSIRPSSFSHMAEIMESVKMAVDDPSHRVQQAAFHDVRNMDDEERAALLTGPCVSLHFGMQHTSVPKRVLMAFSPAMNPLLSAEQDTTEVHLPHGDGQVTKLAYEMVLQFMHGCIVSGKAARLEHSYCLQNAIEIYRFARLLRMDLYVEEIKEYIQGQLPRPSQGYTLGRTEFVLFQNLDSQDPIYKDLVAILDSDRSTTTRSARKAYYSWIEQELPRIGASMKERAAEREEMHRGVLQEAKAECEAEVPFNRMEMRQRKNRDLTLREVDLKSPRKRKTLNWDL